VAEVQLDRPAVLTPIKPRANVLLASFGAGDRALMQVLTGQTVPRGRLPFELPSSMAAVEAQRPGAPADSAAPLYPLGYRLAQ
jgi:beta-glucosidase